MGMSYGHTLVPQQIDYQPAPSQVAKFFSALVELGAAPVNPQLQARTHVERANWTDRSIFFSDPRTGERLRLPRYVADIGSVPEIPSLLEGLDDYNMRIYGEGPPKLSALAFESQFELSSYVFEIDCCLRPEVVSTSHFDKDERLFFGIPIKRWLKLPVSEKKRRWRARKVEGFSSPCPQTHTIGFFTSPTTGDTIEVPGAGCARFWIQFEFGKWFFPQVTNSLDLLPLPIIRAAEESFEIRFSQGCHWG
jgi:hypothetical protein